MTWSGEERINRIKRAAIDVYWNESGENFIEYAVVTAVTLALIITVIAVTLRLMIRKAIPQLYEFAEAMLHDPLSTIRRPNPVVKLVVVGLILLIGLIVTSSLVGAPWERDWQEETSVQEALGSSEEHSEADQQASDSQEERAGA